MFSYLDSTKWLLDEESMTNRVLITIRGYMDSLGPQLIECTEYRKLSYPLKEDLALSCIVHAASEYFKSLHLDTIHSIHVKHPGSGKVVFSFINPCYVTSLTRKDPE